jgi:hypothetical protein
MSNGLARLLLAAILMSAAAAAGAQDVSVTMPRIVPEEACPERPERPDEIVVCGQREEESPYRVPQEFRGQTSHEDRDASWDARVRDEEALQRFGSQNVGPFGYLQRGREMYCGWLAERQVAQGRRPDCGRRPRPNEDTDWLRR